jgi:hypothetical protein
MDGITEEASLVLVCEPRWRMSACVVFDDALHSGSGNVIYGNHGVQFVQLRWGRIVLDEIHLDTQRVAEFDRYVADPAAP